MPKPATLDHLRSRKKPTTRDVNIVLDPELAERYDEAKIDADVLEQRFQKDPTNEEVAQEARDAQRRLAEVVQQLEDAEAVVRFRFRSIPPNEYDALLNAHQPTPEQRKAARVAGGRANYNPDTFPQALVAACLIEPKLSLDEVESLWKDENWNSAELEDLFVTALQVNSTRRTVDLPKG